MAQPLDKRNIRLKMRKFKTRDGDMGYSLKGSVDIGNGRSLSIDMRCSSDGALELKPNTKNPEGPPVAFASVAMWKNEPKEGGFGRGNRGKSSW